MRTTLSLDDHLLICAKKRAIDEHIPLSRVIEDALRQSLAKPKGTREPIRLITASGSGVKPGVDLDNGCSLLEIMDDPS